MPRGQKIDSIETARMNFQHPDSFVSLGGKLFLRGYDYLKQVTLVIARDDSKCRDCGRVFDAHWDTIGGSFDIHHVIKRSDGGSDDLENLLLVCRDCHTERHPEKQPQWSGS